MVTNKFKALRNRLPKQYARQIAENLPELTRRQVILVFTGEITNLVVVEKVIDEARRLVRKMAAIDRKSTVGKKRNTRKYTKPRV